MEEREMPEGERPEPKVIKARTAPTASSRPSTDAFDEIDRKLDLILEAIAKES